MASVDPVTALVRLLFAPAPPVAVDVPFPPAPPT